MKNPEYWVSKNSYKTIWLEIVQGGMIYLYA
jgi:hypothetical protein